MEKVYRVEDSLYDEVEFFSESELIGRAETWAERINDFRKEDKDDVESVDYIVTDVESAIEVYEMASIWVKEVKSENHKTTCLVCETTDEMTFVFGMDKRHSDDFEVNCTRCDNWESGTLKNLGTFKMEVV